MTTIRFALPSAASSGQYADASTWTPQQVPGPGDTAVITTGTLSLANQMLTGVSLFAFTVTRSTGTGPNLQLRSVVLGAGSTLVVEGDPFVGTGVGITQSLENDGRIELSDYAGLGGANPHSIVNKGVIALQNVVLQDNDRVENDGTLLISDSYFQAFNMQLSGSGRIVLAPGSDISFYGVPAQQTVVFTGGTAAHTTLAIQSTLFQAPISGFVAGDTIRISGFSGTPTSVTYAATGAHAGRLTVGSASYSVSENLLGDYVAADFRAVATAPGGGVSITTTRTDGGTEATAPVYRFFDTTTGTHFYTAITAERDTIVNTRPDLSFEGVGLNAADPNGPAAAPVFRFFDTRFGTHFYTASAAERDSVAATRPDLTFEGTGLYDHVAPQPGDSPVYRFFDTRYGTHFYTADATERATILATRPDLTPEGIGFYAPG